MARNTEIIAQLQEQISKLAPMRHSTTEPFCIASLDSQVKGWPKPGVSIVSGKIGSGRIGVCLPAIANATNNGKLVAIIDTNRWLNPLGLTGVELSMLLVVRPPPPRTAWATEQLARTSGLSMLILLDPPILGQSLRRISKATFEGGCTTVIITETLEKNSRPKLHLRCLGRGVIEVNPQHHRHKLVHIGDHRDT